MGPMSTVEARLRLWQLLSPTLPIGAYAYSRGLEYAVAAGWVRKAGYAIKPLTRPTISVEMP